MTAIPAVLEREVGESVKLLTNHIAYQYMQRLPSKEFCPSASFIWELAEGIRERFFSENELRYDEVLIEPREINIRQCRSQSCLQILAGVILDYCLRKN